MIKRHQEHATKVFFDGGNRPASTGMETAVVIQGRSYLQRNLGLGTSMEAEWLALIEAMRLAGELGLSNPILLGDAASVISQANGLVRCPAAHVRHLAIFRLLPPPHGRVRIRYLRRTQNLAGIALARLHDR